MLTTRKIFRYITCVCLMGALILFCVFSFLFLLGEARNAANCQSIKCSHGDPDVRSPFWFRGHCTNHFGRHPKFELRCQDNKTTIHFPGYGDLEVKSISYDIKKLSLLDPKNCVHEVFLNLDLSPTPFRYYYVTRDYTYLSCSARISSSLEQVPCLSGSDYHVYVVESSSSSSSAVTRFCKAVKTVAIPFAYSSHISDDSFGLGLTWNVVAGSEDGEAKGNSYMAYGKVLGFISICILVVVTMASSKAYYSNKFGKQTDDEMMEKLVIAKL